MNGGPWIVTYVSANGSRGTFVKSTQAQAIDKIADLTLAPHKVTINRVGSHGYLVTAIRNTLHDF